jgi:hypothetical protein
MKLGKSPQLARMKKSTSRMLRMTGFGKGGPRVSSGKFLSSWLLATSVLVMGLSIPQAVYAAATITVINRDGAGEGLNDPTPFSPVGGNNAPTLGQARFNAFQRAASIWANLLTSGVEIEVEAQMDPLRPGLGGQADPNSVHRDFPNAPVANTWYVQALANSLAGMDLAPTIADISAQFNSTAPFYLGLDGTPPAGQVDFVTVVLHELAHGLGFLSLVDLQTGAKVLGFDDAYMRFLENHGANPANYPVMTNAQRVAANVAGPNLHWIGPQVVAVSGGLSAGVGPGPHVQMYAPNPAEPGSSVSHFTNIITPDQLMEPALPPGVAIHSVGLAGPLLADLGWKINLQGVSLLCDIQLSQPVYDNGNVVTASTLRLANVGTATALVEIKMWFEAPGSPPIPFVNLGADGSVQLPPGFDQNFGPLQLFAVTPSLPRGAYALNCRLLDPVTGASSFLDENSFTIR